MSVQLDKTDVAILKSLQRDSRTSFRDIAKEIGVSVPTVSARVERLEKLGVLRGYHADIDVEKLDETTMILIVKCTPPSVDDVAKAVAAMEHVRKLFILRGARIMAEAVIGGSRTVDTFLEKLSRIPGVVEYDHYMSARRLKEEPSAMVEDSLVAVLECMECHKVIEGEPVHKKLDGRDYYFCCRSCDRLFTEKYGRIKGGV